MKKQIAILLSIVLLSTAIPNNYCMAYTNNDNKLNYKKMTMYVKETRRLSIDAKGVVKWSTSNPKIATVSKNGKVIAKNTGKATITATIKKKNYNCNVNVVKKSKINSKLQTIAGWVIGDIWNDGFCDISWYISEGTDSCGRTMDLDETLDLLADALAHRKSYNSFINSLNGNKYKKVKKYWKSLNKKILELQDRVYNKGVDYGDEALNTKYFIIYMHKFSNIVYKLNC